MKKMEKKMGTMMLDWKKRWGFGDFWDYESYVEAARLHFHMLLC